MRGLTGFAVSSVLKPPLKAAEDIAVDYAALVDITATIVRDQMSKLPAACGPQRPQLVEVPGDRIFGAIKKFNDSLTEHGYAKKDVVLGGAFAAQNAQSFRIGNLSVLIMSFDKMRVGGDLELLQKAHEYGHLYRRHGVNKLFELHPKIYDGKNPEIVSLQRRHADIFAQVDIPHEIAMWKKSKPVDAYTADKEAEEMAVRLTCLSDVAIKETSEALKASAQSGFNPCFVSLSNDEQRSIVNGLRGESDGAKIPTPFCSRTNRASLNAHPK